MTDLFLNVLNTSFAASWVVLAVVLARLLLKKAPRWMVCGLWILVAARLLIGGSITAPFSLIPSTEVISPESLYDQTPTIDSGVTILDNAINPVYTDSLRPAPGASVNPLQVWLAVFANLWVLGMGAMATWAAVSWLRVRRQVRESIPAEDGVYLCDRIASPFIFGLFRPKIYLPSDLSSYARSHVIAHERAHLCRRDHWWKPLAFVLLTVNWFNPAIWVAYILLCRDIEMACDEKVVRNLNLEDKKAYSAALLGCSVNPRRITACPLAFGEVGVKQRVKSVLHYKKPAFWVILAAVVLTVVLAFGLLTSPAERVSEIRYNGNLYVLFNDDYSFLPAEEAIGTLRSVLHNTKDHPTEDFQATNLDESLAGCPLYQENDLLFLVKYDGSCLAFAPKHSLDDVLEMLRHRVQIDLTLEGTDVSLKETVQNFTGKEYRLRLLEILASHAQPMQLSPDWNYSMLAVNYADGISMNISAEDYAQHCLLTRRESDWLMVYRDEAYAVSAWSFECPELDAFLVPWQEELLRSTELFSGFSTPENPIYLEYNTTEMEEISIRYGIPAYNMGSDTTNTHWEWQGHVSYTDGTIQIQCRPFGREDWMTINYCDTEDTIYCYNSGIYAESITLANGATGTRNHSGDSTRWDTIVLDITHGQLWVATPDTCNKETDWTETDYRMARTIIETISLTKNGSSLFSVSGAALGISMHLENLTATGATLVCTQDGTLWHQITTGANWSVQEYRDGFWVDLLPEETVWTTEAYSVPIGESHRFALNWGQMIGALGPGQYRIVKTFSGYTKTGLIGYAKETVRETCCAEFTIDSLGITLRAEDVTPTGLTLHYYHTGGSEDWKEIVTSPAWTLERLENDTWVSIMPEDTAWNAILNQVPMNGDTAWNIDFQQITGSLTPGDYRIGKTFWGHPEVDIDPTVSKPTIQATEQTCYAEFAIGTPSLASFSPELYQILQEDWNAYDAKSLQERLLSSRTPGYCFWESDDWTEVERFVGMEIANPLEELAILEKGSCVAMPIGYNGAPRFRVTFQGTREGEIQQLSVSSGYRRGDIRICVDASLGSDPAEGITSDSNESYEARTATLTRGSIRYSIRVIGAPGTGDQLLALLDDLIPYY